MAADGGISRGGRAALTALACAALASYAVVAMTTAAVSTALPHSHAYVGDFMLAHFLGFLISSVVTGFLSDRLGRKGFMLGGCLLLCVGSVGMIWCERFWAGMGSMFVSGVGGGGLGPPALALIAQIHTRRRSGMMSLVEAWFCIGAMAWPLAVAAILKAAPVWRLPGVLAALNRPDHAWRLPFALAALLPIGLGAVIAAVRFPVLHDARRRDTGLRLALMRHPFFLFSAAAIFTYAITESGAQYWLPRYIKERFNSGVLIENSSLALFWGAMGLSRLVWPVLQPRVRERRMLIGSMAAALTIHATAVAVNRDAAAMWSFGALGLAFGAVWPLLVAGVGARFHRMAGTATGTLVAISGVGAMLGPFLLGQIGHVTTLHLAMWVAVAATALTFVACLLIPGRRNQGTSRTRRPSESAT